MIMANIQAFTYILPLTQRVPIAIDDGDIPPPPLGGSDYVVVGGEAGGIVGGEAGKDVGAEKQP